MPVVEAEQVVDSLKKRGIPVEYVLFPDEGHGWRKTPNRIRLDGEGGYAATSQQIRYK